MPSHGQHVDSSARSRTAHSAWNTQRQPCVCYRIRIPLSLTEEKGRKSYSIVTYKDIKTKKTKERLHTIYAFFANVDSSSQPKSLAELHLPQTECFGIRYISVAVIEQNTAIVAGRFAWIPRDFGYYFGATFYERLVMLANSRTTHNHAIHLATFAS